MATLSPVRALKNNEVAAYECKAQGSGVVVHAARLVEKMPKKPSGLDFLTSSMILKASSVRTWRSQLGLAKMPKAFKAPNVLRW